MSGIMGPSTQSMVDNIMTRVREDQQPVYEAAAKVNAFSARMDSVEAIADDVNIRIDTVEPAALMAATRVFDVRQYGAIGTSDDSATIQAALDDASVTGAGVTMPTGTYTLMNPLDIGNATLDLNGSTLDFSGSSLPAFSRLVSTTGTLSNLPSLATAVDKWSDTVTFSSAHGLVVGDWFCTYNPTDSSYSQSRPSYRDGMYFQVVQVVSSTQVRTMQRSITAFSTACTVHKMTPSSGSITNGTIKGKRGVNLYGFTAELTAGITLTNLVVLDCEYGGIQVSKSVNFIVSGNQVSAPMDTIATEDHYGIMVSNCQHGIVDGNFTLAQSHSLTIGGYSGPGCVPNRWVTVTNNHVATTGVKPPLDSHGIAEYIVFRGNTVYGGISAGGDHMVIESNTIHSRPDAPPISYTVEACGADLKILNNNILLGQQWSNANGGAININFTTSGNTGLPHMIRDDGHLEIRGNTFDCGGFIPSNSSVLGSLVQIYFVNSPTSRTRITFSENVLQTTVTSTSLSQYYFLTVRTTATTAIRSLVVENNNFGTAGVYAWGIDAQSIRIANNVFQNTTLYPIYVQMKSTTATYPSPVVEISGNSTNTSQSNAVRVLGYSAGAMPSVCAIRNNTFLNANGAASGSAVDGAGVFVGTCGLLMITGNIWGDMRSTPLQTRRLNANTISVLSRADNETVGTVTTDTLTSVTTDRAPQ